MTQKRIAIAYDCLYPLTTGGGERQYVAFADELVSRGHDVHYLTARQWVSAPRTSFAIRAVTGKLHLYGRDGARSTSAAIRYALGLFWFVFKHRRHYDTVLVSGLPVLNVFAARAALAGSPTQVVVDYLEVWDRRQWISYGGRIMGSCAWLVQRAAILLTPLATCHSQLSAGRLLSEGLRSSPLVSPGLIDQDGHGAFRDISAVPQYVLYAGRHVADKRVETLPAAVMHARKIVPNLQLVILGSGPTTDRVRAAVDQLGSPGWISLPGFVAQDELEKYMADAACLVNPSRREGYGLVVVEAASHGTPAIVVDHPANASVELIDNGVNGFVAPTDDDVALGEAIAQAVEGGPGLRSSTRAWYEDAVKTKSIAKTVDAILDAIAPQH